MLPKYNAAISEGERARIRKYCKDKDVSRLGAFPEGETLTVEVSVPRSIGEAGVVLRLFPDGEDSRDIPMDFEDNEGGESRYSLELPLYRGLYYWELLFLRGFDTLFTDSFNNVDFTLERSSGGRFRLLVYGKDSAAPDWFKGGIMYQIFPDRFARGEKVFDRADAVIHESFEGDIEQFADVPGGEVENNEFFGGSLYGVADKLDYLDSLGVTAIYLNPIFEAYSNHRYDTGDYERVDPLLGGDAALEELIKKADERGMKIILDGVFNHTGSDSRYFDKKHRYGGGAYSDENSPCRGWYNFRSYPDDYECWWGVRILPRLNHANESCRRYFTGEGGIAEKYIEMGIGGWRLDVADELSDEFLDEFTAAVKKTSGGEGIVIGEVWENAADKIAYGRRRRDLQGGQLDSVMNYPLRNAVLEFMRWGDASLLYDTLTEIYGSYPTFVSHSLMNLLGTHDTERIMTVLGGDEDFGLTNAEKSTKKMTEGQYRRGRELLKLAAVIQYTVYGVPSLYYGDEAGLEGYGDPFCRRPYPWGREDGELLDFYRSLGKMRREARCLRNGDFSAELWADNRVIKIIREGEGEKLAAIVSRADTYAEVLLDGEYMDAFSGEVFSDGVTVAPDSAVILIKK